jgi:hypothetical protein
MIHRSFLQLLVVSVVALPGVALAQPATGVVVAGPTGASTGVVVAGPTTASTGVVVAGGSAPSGTVVVVAPTVRTAVATVAQPTLSDSERLRAVVAVPVAAQAARDAGSHQAEVARTIATMHQSDVRPDHVVAALQQTADSTREHGHLRGLSDFVQQQLAAGVRGQALADAIRAEHERRGEHHDHGDHDDHGEHEGDHGDHGEHEGEHHDHGEHEGHEGH